MVRVDHGYMILQRERDALVVRPAGTFGKALTAAVPGSAAMASPATRMTNPMTYVVNDDMASIPQGN